MSGHLHKVTVLLLFFHFGFLLFLFLVWLLWIELPLCWIKVVRVGILVLFLILKEIILSFHHWLWCWKWACHIWPLLCWGMFPPFVERFYHKWMLNFVTFSPFIEMIIWFLFFSLLIWYITLIDLQIINHPCILPGINPTWSWWMILLIYCWIWFPNLLLRIFTCTFISDIVL